jgi:hypothetical protein
MKSFVKVCSFGGAVIIAMTASLFAPIHAVADDATPPPVQTEELPPVETEIPPSDDVQMEDPSAIRTEPPSLVEEGAGGIEIATSPSNEPGGDQGINQEVGETSGNEIAQIIEQLPEGTGIRLETEEGVEPLATTQAENLILVGDPIWCPSGIDPIPNLGGCSGSYTSLEDLVINLPDPGGPGVIWIMEGVDSSVSAISLDGANYANWDAEDLEIRGGWNGDAFGTISTTTTFSVPIEVINWAGTITINDLIITGVPGTGLTVDIAGDVLLRNLDISGNDNTGLSISSGGTVTGENITANNNGLASLSGFGAEIYGVELDLSGVNEFTGNYNSGLIVSTTGNILTDNLTANNNGIFGNAFGVELYSAAGDVNMLGANQFAGNLNNGLYIEALNGSIGVENISANNNGLVALSGYGAEVYGLELDMSGMNEFNGNYNSGLYVSTVNDIVIDNLTASNNGVSQYVVGAELYSVLGDIELLGSNHFEGNINNGLYIEAINGSITAENIIASNNGIGNTYAPGAELYAASLNLTGNNEFVGNNDTGLIADTSGDITIMNINASNNGIPGFYGSGAELYSIGMVTITGINVFSGNTSEGLVIEAGGGASVSNITALNNSGSGLELFANTDSYVDCGSVLNNGNWQIDASLVTGSLTLAGVDFGGDPDNNVSIDGSQLTLVSNTCFSYPDYYGEGNLGSGGSGGNKGVSYLDDSPFTVKYVSIVGGQDVNLDCDFYKATYVLLEDGDGAIIPCPIVGSAKLDNVESMNPFGTLPDGKIFISGMNLTISGDSLVFKPVEAQDIIWYFNGVNNETGGYAAVYWNGNEWIDITDQIPPFLTIFFLVPEEFNNRDMAILYWDGADWIELSNGTQLGQGRIVSGLGYSKSGEYFQANVNFTGIFVLVQK